MQRGGDVADIGHKGGGVLLGHAGDVVDVLLGGHDHATLVALLLKQDELAGGQVEHGDAKGIDERVVGPAHAVRAIGVLFHGDPFDPGESVRRNATDGRNQAARQSTTNTR